MEIASLLVDIFISGDIVENACTAYMAFLLCASGPLRSNIVGQHKPCLEYGLARCLSMALLALFHSSISL
jgi:hypothetical protein